VAPLAFRLRHGLILNVCLNTGQLHHSRGGWFSDG
jgi:hypothetical protein